MASQGGPSRRSMSLSNISAQGKKKAFESGGASESSRKSLSSSRSMYSPLSFFCITCKFPLD